MILILVRGHCYGKLNIFGGTRFTEVTGSELGLSISLDLTDMDVFKSDWVIPRSCEFIDCFKDRVAGIIINYNEMRLCGGLVNHDEVALKDG
jgi:hypothetical protein